MQAANVILVNVSMMGIHSGNLELSALNIKTVPAGYYLNRKVAISQSIFERVLQKSVSVEGVTVKMRHGSVTQRKIV